MPDHALIQTIERELVTFESLPLARVPTELVIEKPCDHAWLLRPAAIPAGGKIGLTVLGVVHGNEVAGLPILNAVLKSLLDNATSLKVPVALVLGNPAAALQNRRFLERDLNRSFSRDQTATWEDRRARDIEKILTRTAFLLDLHQTSEPSETPFFIFPYSAEGYRFARAVAPQFPIVTHWGAPFSKDGQCTDEYLNGRGGVGITLELGQNGMRSEAVAAGVAATHAALKLVSRKLSGEEFPRPEGEPQVYTWGEILPFPASGGNPLHPGWYNFKTVRKGEVLGDTPQGSLVSPITGRMLFPKYVRDQAAARPAELCRILKPIREEELGRT